MISQLQVKKLNIFLSFCILYFIYFNIKFGKNNRISGQTKYFAKSISDEKLDPNLLIAIENFRTNRSIDIKYSEKRSFTKNSVELMKTYDLNSDSFFKEKLLDICSDDETRCVTSDLRAFIQAYFKETTGNLIFEEIKAFGKKYMLRKDSEGVLKEDDGPRKMKAFGLMLSLALATETILDFEFSQAIITPHSKKFLIKHLESELYWIDKEQYAIYIEIIHSKDGRNKKYRYDPNSIRPFKYAHDTSNLEKPEDILLFDALDYPIDLAAEKIFVTPFEESRKLIDEGTQRFFGKPVENISNYFTDNTRDDDKILVDLYMLYMHSPGTLDIVQWRHNSVYDWSTRMFWKALNNLSVEDRLKIYRKATGFHYVPDSGIERLPKTRLVAHDKREIEFIQSRYEIRIPYYASLEEMTACMCFILKI